MAIKLEFNARKILANNIVYYRLEKGWSQEDFADKLGTTPTYVSNLENAKRNTSNKTKRRYKSLLDYVDEVNNFIKTFNTENEYNTIEEDIDSDEIKYIRFMYENFAELTHILKNEKYDKALKRIIYFLKYERPKYLHNKFVGELDRFKTISFLIIVKKYEEAYEETMKFIKKNDKWFVRAS